MVAGRYDLVIVGMGSGGMVAAEFAATLKLRVAVVERGRPGGDCLWTGCVPSKTLLASAKAAHTIRTAGDYGLAAVDAAIDTAPVWRRIRAVRAGIAGTEDDPARYEAMGVEVWRGQATLTGPHRVHVEGNGPELGGTDLETRFILVCTGSRPAIPDLPGLAEAGFLTSENLFELDRAPARLLIIGGGPIAVEMAQAMQRLGVNTTVLQRGPRLLPRDEPRLVSRLTECLAAEGVRLAFDVRAERVTNDTGEKTVHGHVDSGPATWTADELLVAAGRRPNVEALGLEPLGVVVDLAGIRVDERQRTTVDSVYAAGDVVGRHRFTHAAGYEAVRAVRDMFFPGKGKAGGLIPWCTFTDPELASTGLTRAQAEQRYGAGAVTVWEQDLVHSDRARAEGASGAIVIVTAHGRVVGAQILAPAAGEMIHELSLAIHQRLKLTQVAGLVHIYPTLATGIGQLATDAAFQQAARLGWLVRRQRAARPGWLVRGQRAARPGWLVRPGKRPR